MITERDGARWVVGTRVPIDTVIEAFKAGATLEEICADYSVLRPEAVEAVLVHYATHKSEVDGYLAERREDAARIRLKLEARGGWKELRQLLLTRRKQAAR